jgi:purine nucleosidase
MHKVIIDTDPGIDDTLAIRYALRSPEIEVVGFNIVSGNVVDSKGFANLVQILKQENCLHLPIHLGRGQPLQKAFRHAEDTHGEFGLGYFNNYQAVDKKPSPTTAAQFLLDNSDVTILALGPLTNLADAYLLNPQIASQIKVISMGGNLYEAGNMSSVSEYNYWSDPEAAKIVLQHFNVTMVGLDVTRQLKFYPEDISNSDDLAILRFYFEFHQEYEGFYGAVINDPMVMDFLLHPQDYSTQNLRIAVLTEDGEYRGQTIETNDIKYRLNQALVEVLDIDKIKARVKALSLNN